MPNLKIPIRQNKIKAAGIFAAVFFAAGAGFAQITVSNIQWRAKVPRSGVYAGVKSVGVNEVSKTDKKLRLLIFLKNDSEKSVEGIVVRYTLKFRIKKIGDKKAKAVWTLPFHLDEIRLSKIKALSEKVVKVMSVNLNTELKKLKNNGFMVDFVGIDAMVEPKANDDIEKSVYSSVLKMK